MKHIIATKRTLATLALLSFLTLAAVFGLSLLGRDMRSAAPGPLRVHPTNPRYFTDGSGRAVYLTGSHTWDNLQDSGEIGSALKAFDYQAYLNFMTSNNHNLMRLWAWEGGVNHAYYSPLAYVRTSSGHYDLTRFNQAYFDRLRSRVSQAWDRGIYVSLMLFQGWSLYSHGYGNPWPLHPYNAPNNINGIHGDVNGDGEGHEVHSLQVPAVTRLQKAYLRKVIDTVNDLDNVLYEITNETAIYSYAWQNAMVRYIKQYEQTKPKQHPVGLSFFDSGGRGSMDLLLGSDADWIAPASEGEYEYDHDPTPAGGRKVIIVDTDHLHDHHPPGTFVWRSFLRGLNPIYMDGIDFTEPHAITGEYRDRGLTENILSSRQAMGDTRRYAQKMHLAAMTPRGDLSSTGYVLANPGAEYLIYQSGSASFSVDLRSGTYRVEWFNPSTGQTASGGRVSGGGSRTFDPPFGGEAVLYLKGASARASPTLSARRTPSPTPAQGQCHIAPVAGSSNGSTLKWSTPAGQSPSPDCIKIWGRH